MIAILVHVLAVLYRKTFLKMVWNRMQHYKQQCSFWSHDHAAIVSNSVFVFLVHICVITSYLIGLPKIKSRYKKLVWTTLCYCSQPSTSTLCLCSYWRSIGSLRFFSECRWSLIHSVKTFTVIWQCNTLFWIAQVVSALGVVDAVNIMI